MPLTNIEIDIGRHGTLRSASHSFCSTAQPKKTFGEALDIHKLEQLSRYEVHLDRKLERMLSMLLRLKDLRQGTLAG